MSKPKVVIDIGHGGKDSGAVHGKLREKDLNLKVGLRVAKYVNTSKIKLVFTRKADNFISIANRRNFTNRENADFFVSIHVNSATPPFTPGFETLIFPGSIKGEKMAKIIHKNVRKNGLIYNDRGIKRRDNVGVLKCKAPAVLLEMGFINSSEDMKKLVGREELWAKSVGESINQYFGATSPRETITKEKPTVSNKKPTPTKEKPVEGKMARVKYNLLGHRTTIKTYQENGVNYVNLIDFTKKMGIENVLDNSGLYMKSRKVAIEKIEDVYLYNSMVINGVNYVPLRAVFDATSKETLEEIGYGFNVISLAKQVKAKKSNKVKDLKIKIGEEGNYKNLSYIGEKGEIYISIRELALLLGFGVDYLVKEKEIVLSPSSINIKDKNIDGLIIEGVFYAPIREILGVVGEEVVDYKIKENVTIVKSRRCK